MRVDHRCVSICLALFAACAMLPRAIGAAEAAAANGEVTGRVIDRQGKGVAGAKLQLKESRGDELLATATTQTDGRFAIGGVPIGCRRCLLVDADGMGRECSDEIDVFPDGTTDVGPIRVLPGYVCQGRVVGPDGQSVADVDVVVQAHRYELGHTINRLGPSWQIKSNAEGQFETPPLPPCYATFSVKAPPGLVQGKYFGHMVGPDPAQLRLPDVWLVPEALLEGVVTDKLGTPVFNAEVWYVSHGAEPANTDSQGHFALRGMTAEQVHKARLGVDAAGFAAYFEPAAKDEVPRKIALTPCGYINGHAVDAETGQPVSIKRVVVCEVRRDADGTPHSHGCGEARFDQPRKGDFRVTVSTAGEKHLQVTADGYHYAEQYVLGFDLPGAVPEVTIKIRRKGSSASAAGQRIGGIVRRDHQPAGQAWVSLWQKKKEWDPVNSSVRRGRTVDGTYRPAMVDVLTAADGSYSLDVADPGEYYVTARSLHGAPAISPALSVRANEPLPCDLDLPTGGTIRGRVKGVSPEQAERLWVVAFGHAPFRSSATIEPDGRFILRDVPPGEIGLKVGHDGHLDADVPRYPAIPKETWDTAGEPWKRAVRVMVGKDQEVRGIDLEYPTPGTPDLHED
ncbi:MAG TPA: carboxypeptidase-like regulatory domain-containing protein [Pirellulales bacterium]|jgi:5-hydroxyisourate hydrolase-like protein (transthyretin family)